MDLLTPDQRIQALQSQLSALIKPTESPQQQISQNTVETTEQMVNRILDEKLSKLLGDTVQAVQPAQPVDYGTQLLVAVGCALTEEQQLWLSNESNRMEIPKFLSSAEGQAITRRFFTTYKQFKDTQCK